MRRARFIAGVGAGLMSTEGAKAQACSYNQHSTAFNEYFKPYTACRDPFQGRVPPVYRIPGSGPPVIVLHEVSGAGPSLFAFAKRVADEGFTPYVPILFGHPNHETGPIATVFQAARLCLKHEFSCLKAGKSSPVVDWVRKLSAVVYAEHQPAHPGIGVIGLCLTGNFALALADQPHLLAPVVSEPALPFAILPELRADLGLDAKELQTLRQRLRNGLPLAVFRFKDDPIVPNKRMATLQTLLDSCGAKMTGDYNLPPTCRGAHAVFTDHYDPDSTSSKRAFAMLIRFLKGQLG
jgi:dienelactone hydrolase